MCSTRNTIFMLYTAAAFATRYPTRVTRGVLSRQVCLGYTGHFFDDLPECSHVHGGPYLGLTATIHNNSTKKLFLIGAEKRISFAPFALSMVILPRQARGKHRECTQKEEMHFFRRRL
jgi:hypothetical protein